MDFRLLILDRGRRVIQKVLSFQRMKWQQIGSDQRADKEAETVRSHLGVEMARFHLEIWLVAYK